MGLDTVELIMTVEDLFEIQIPDNHAENIATVQQLADYVFEKIKTKPTYENMPKKEFEEQILRLVENLTGIPYEEIDMSASFTNDLGMD